MHFDLVDRVLDLQEDRIVTLKHVTAGEEYLQDHFPTFPVLPGVMMVEAMTQAARRLLASRDPGLARHVLGGVRALKFGAMVRPGDSLRIEVSIFKDLGEGAWECKGAAAVVRPDATPSLPTNAGGAEPRLAVSGRLVLRPLHLGKGAAVP